jgi:hypothetical protein
LDRFLCHGLIKGVEFVGEGLILTSDATRFSDPAAYNYRVLSQGLLQVSSTLVPPFDPAGRYQPSEATGFAVLPPACYVKRVRPQAFARQGDELLRSKNLPLETRAPSRYIDIRALGIHLERSVSFPPGR